MSAVVAVEDTRESIVGEAASATCATAVDHAWGFKPTHIEDSVELALETVNHELRPAAQLRRITIGIDDVLVQASSAVTPAQEWRPRRDTGKDPPRQTLQQVGLSSTAGWAGMDYLSLGPPLSEPTSSQVRLTARRLKANKRQ